MLLVITSIPVFTPLKHTHQHKYLHYREIVNNKKHGRLTPYAGQDAQV